MIIDRKNYRRAFTLVEMLLALAITTIIVLGMHGAYRNGRLMWERSESGIEEYNELSTIMDVLRNEISSLFVLKYEGGEENQEHSFILSGDQLTFCTLNPSYNNLPGNGRMSKVRYRLQRDDEEKQTYLLRSEEYVAGGKMIAIADRYDSNEDEVVSKSFSNISFQALIKGESGEEAWEYDYSTNDTPPLAIKVILQIGNSEYHDGFTIEQVFPVFCQISDEGQGGEQ